MSLITSVQDLYNSLGIFKDLVNPIANTANQFKIFGLAVEAVQGQLSFGLPQAAQLTEDQLNALNNTDWSVITGNIATLTESLDTASQDRNIDLFLRFHGSSAPGVGITSALNDFLTEFYAIDDSLTEASGSVAETAKKIDPFKAWSDALRTSVRKATVKASLLAKGLPAELADSVINAEGFGKIYKRLIAGGQEAIDKFIKAFQKSADPSEAIGNRVSKITSLIEKNLEDAKTAIEDFKTLSKDFAKSITDFGAISTFQPDAGVPITAMGITANVRQRLGMVREFASVLKQLQSAKVPLNNAALADIVGMGPFEGLPYAKALLEAGSATISGLNQLQNQFVTPASIIGNIGAEAQTGTTMAALQGATNFTVAQGGINITVNGEITAQTRQDIETAVTNAFIRVGRERRNARRAGLK